MVIFDKKQFLLRIADALPYYGNLNASTKDELIKESIVELIVLRIASCYDRESGNVQGVSGANYSMQMFQRGGASPAFMNMLNEIIKDIEKLMREGNTVTFSKFK